MSQKINMEPKSWRFGSDDFPDFNGVILMFYVNFRGCSFIFTPKYGEMIRIDEHIIEWGGSTSN